MGERRKTRATMITVSAFGRVLPCSQLHTDSRLDPDPLGDLRLGLAAGDTAQILRPRLSGRGRAESPWRRSFATICFLPAENYREGVDKPRCQQQPVWLLKLAK